MSDTLQKLRAAGFLSALDLQLAATLGRLGELSELDDRDETVLLSIALLSRHVSRGHVCLPLPELTRGGLDPEAQLQEDLPIANLESWLAALRSSPLVSGEAGLEAPDAALESPPAATPLVLDDQGRLYFRRYFELERALATQVLTRADAAPVVLDEALLERGLTRYFGPFDPSDLQRLAAETALRRKLTLISGGPGTGKTSTVVKILALLCEQALARGERLPRARLMAPTGKAAVRLVEAIRSARDKLDCSEAVRAAIPSEVTTIHRALVETQRVIGADALERAKPLAADLVLVDESSMVDLTLMARLLAAIPSAARVILLGDRDQLASVEAGAVLGDLCGAGVVQPAASTARGRSVAGSVVQLQRSYRYAAGSGIAELARAIQAGDENRALEVLADPGLPDVALSEEPADLELSAGLNQAVQRGYGPYLELVRSEPGRALSYFDRFRVLCAHRRGPRGVDSLNRAIAQLLFEQGYLPRALGMFIGRPVLVTQNDYRNRLWNGDVGLIAPERRDGGGPTSAFFLSAEGELRRIGLGRLPACESAFALSVHKSQGSEVDEVAVVLPAAASPVLTRELLYTAVTRARRRVTIHAPLDVLRTAIGRNVARSSGLASLIYGAVAAPPAAG